MEDRQKWRKRRIGRAQQESNEEWRNCRKNNETTDGKRNKKGEAVSGKGEKKTDLQMRRKRKG